MKITKKDMIVNDSGLWEPKTLTITEDQVKALAHTVRFQIIKSMGGHLMNLTQIKSNLTKSYADTTIRHHIYILEKFGLLQVSLLKERRGSYEKYYGTKFRIVDKK